MDANELREYQRLRAEGRWPQANEFREAERKRLREGGRSRQQARDESWELMLAKFPPVGETKAASSTEESGRIAETDDSVFIEHSEDEWQELIDLAQDPGAWNDWLESALSWAHGFHDIVVTPSRAPSVLAWLLWKLAREDGERFLMLYISDYYLRHGRRVGLPPAKTEREQRVQEQMYGDMEYDRIVARFDEEDRRLGKSPTLLEALDGTSDEDRQRLISQVVERWADEQGLNQSSPANSSSKS